MVKKNVIEKISFLFIVPILFIWPAIYNGSPFLYGDSTKYLEMGAGIRWVAERPSFYPFLAFSGPSLGSTFFTIILQACIISLFLYILFIKVNKIRPYLAILPASILAIFTPLAWWVSMLMTEMFLVVLVTLFCLIVLNLWKNWSLTEKILTAFFLLFVMLMHITYTYTILGCVFFVMVIQKIISGRIERRSWLLLGLSTLALFSFPVLSAIKGGDFSNTETQSTTYKFLIARMGGDGIIKEEDLRWFLRNEKDNNEIEIRVERLNKINQNKEELENNKTSHFITMAARNTTSFHGRAEKESPLFSWDENKYMSYKDMAIHLVQRHPLENLIAIAKGTYRLWTFPYMPADLMKSRQMGAVLKTISPSDYSLFIHSKGITGTLDILVPFLDPLFAIFYGISLLSSLLAIIYSAAKFAANHSFAFLENNSIVLSLTMLSVILIHSILIYTFGGDYARYGSRIATAVDTAGLNLITIFFVNFLGNKNLFRMKNV